MYANFYLLCELWNKHLATVVIKDIANLSCYVVKENLYEVTDAVDSLFSLYFVCYIY